MTGVLLQLAAIGNEDVFFTGNPQMSYFKSVFKRHSNFAMQNINVEFEGSKSLNYDSPTTMYATIPSYGELLKGVNFEFTLPSITKDFPVKWVQNIGSAIINNVKLFIGTQLIETIEGEYIHIYNNINLTSEKLKVYNKMIGHVPELNNGYLNLENDYPKYDPASNKKMPNIPETRIVVPLPFWFNKYDGQEIPLISLNKIPVKLEIELKPIKQLYFVGINESINVLPSKDSDDNIINTQVNSKIERVKFVRPTSLSHKIDPWLFKPKLDINYVYLSKEESKLLKNFEHRYLIERVTNTEFIGNLNEATLQVELFNPTKELYIVPKRDDSMSNNQHSNYTIYDDLEDVNNITTYQNNLYKLCYDYYGKIITKHKELTTQFNEMLNSSLPLNDNIRGADKNYYKPKSLPEGISPLYYYGLFRTNSQKNIDPVIKDVDNKFIFEIEGGNIAYPVIIKTLDKYEVTTTNHDEINLIHSAIKKIYGNQAPNNNDLTNLVNQWKFRESADIPMINNSNYDFFTENIVKSLEIKLNGDVRLGNKDYNYFHKIQPYNHHTGILPKGVLLYSFSIEPERFQPTGACNFSNFESIELLFNLKSPRNNETFSKKNMKYDIKLYTTAYNILKIDNGECQLLFKT